MNRQESILSYFPNGAIYVFNIDLLPFEDESRGHTKQDDLADPQLLEHWR